GILKHAAAIVALTNATTNSYARLGAYAGKLPTIAYSQTDLQAAVRVPSYQSGKSKCLEFRPPDAACNPYLAFSALLMAAIDGIQNKIHPGSPLGRDPYGSIGGTPATPTRLPASYEAALDALAADGDFLLRGDVLSAEVLTAWLEHKRMVDIHALRAEPHPHEIAAYYDA
ncbi:MAG: glutamine synthetase, partial [Aureliella sp.]